MSVANTTVKIPVQRGRAKHMNLVDVMNLDVAQNYIQHAASYLHLCSCRG